VFECEEAQGRRALQALGKMPAGEWQNHAVRGAELAKRLCRFSWRRRIMER
jgi:hypothetical protein